MRILLPLVMLLAASLIPTASAAAVTCAETRHPVQLGGLLGTQSIGASLCVPQGATTIQVLVPGGTYNRTYWDWAGNGTSYVRAMNNAGVATLAMDRLGAGTSSHPLSTLVTGDAAADAIHQVIQAVKPRFQKVVLVSHSVGTALARVETARYHDADGLVLTGLGHLINVVGAAPVFTTLFPYVLIDPQRAGSGGWDPGYLSTARGARNRDFHLPSVDSPEAIAHDEANRDVVTAGEALTTVLEMSGGLTSVTPRLTEPVLLAMGQRDSALCGQRAIEHLIRIGTDCSSTERLYATERGQYPHVASFDAFVVPGAGHSFLYADAAPAFSARVLDWMRAQGF
ncbi:alpha/beta hydrolase [Pseudonocardiaceae bacterium YIM PH 21723]|nr:alpha/beta hydrolase [Pseudonocardiaceae bacterium YIM PH 21723]